MASTMCMLEPGKVGHSNQMASALPAERYPCQRQQQELRGQRYGPYHAAQPHTHCLAAYIHSAAEPLEMNGSLVQSIACVADILGSCWGA